MKFIKIDFFITSFKNIKMSCQLKVVLNYTDSQPPTRGSELSAGYDLYSYENGTVEPNSTKLFDTGISFRVPHGTYGRIAPRSGVSKKGILINAGVIDEDYSGPVKIMVHNLSMSEYYDIKKGERIAQLILEQILTPEINIVETLEETVRGTNGFGSTGK